ncbi:MAG: AraC family transcriptional regulator, partial [Bacillota bacterium]
MEQWEQVSAVQNMQDYIHQHLNEQITLTDLARNAGYSPFHSAKIFKEHVGKAPFEYIRSLRLTQAALKLRDEKVKVLDVAMDFVFDSHEGFTRAFSKEFGITPFKYSKNPPPIQLFMPTPIREQYLFFQRGGPAMERKRNELSASTVFVQVIERPARKLIVKRGKTAQNYFEYCYEVNCDIWGLLCSIKEALYEPIGVWLPERFRPNGTSFYAQGVEVPHDYNETLPESLEIIDLPECQMMVFQGPPFEEDEFYDA